VTIDAAADAELLMMPVLIREGLMLIVLLI